MIGLEVGFTGTRRGWSHDQSLTMISVLKTLRALGYVWLHEGDCIGADTEANKLWRELGGKIHQHPPKRDKLRSFSPFDHTEVPKDYIVRDRDIVNSCSVLIGTPHGPEEIRSGTWTTIRYARSIKVPRIIVFPSGQIVTETV